MEPRPYQPADRDACLAIFDTLSQKDHSAFINFLDTATVTVLEHEGAVIGCGGFTLDVNSTTATLLYGMIEPRFRKMGLGRFLLLYRLRQISSAGVSFVRAVVPPEHAGFYLKQGLKQASTRPDGAVELVMKLTVCP